MRPKKLLFFIPVLIVLACTGMRTNTPNQAEDDGKVHFKVPTPSKLLSPEDRVTFLRDHYWDNFDFQDTVFLSRVDTMEMCSAIGAWIGSYVGPVNQTPLKNMLKKASQSRTIYKYITEILEPILHNPNSQLRSDELYLTLLSSYLESPYLDEYEKMPYEYDYKMASKNRIGHQANDFTITIQGGKKVSLSSITTDYVLLFFNNPGCNMCGQIIEDLKSIPYVNDLLESKRLTVFAVYPDEDITLWKQHQQDMDPRWINGYDKGCLIEKRELYDISAIPSLYLLDRNHSVLVKDASSAPQVAMTIYNLEINKNI